MTKKITHLAQMLLLTLSLIVCLSIYQAAATPHVDCAYTGGLC